MSKQIQHPALQSKKQFFRFLLIAKIHCHARNSPPLHPILKHLDPYTLIQRQSILERR